jgi:hypothetical protein
MKRITIYIALVLVFTGCTKTFLDVNKDPNDPNDVSVKLLLPNTEYAIGYSLALGGGDFGGLSQVLAFYTHQLTTREEQDQYGAVGTNYWINDAWNRMYSADVDLSTNIERYGAFRNLETIITKGTTDGDMIYVGIAQILKAYVTSQFVDAFADIPYSEANRFKQGVPYPKFDKGEDIYPKLFALLDSGIANLKATAPNILKPGTDDVIYGGSVDKWTRAANTIKLKLYSQLRLVQDVSAQVNALETGGKLISTTSESFLLPFGSSSSPDDRNPGYADYYATQRTNYISPWMYEIMKGYNPSIFTGNADPRVPYYWFNQLKPTDAGQSPTDYRDGAFVSIVFGSNGVDRDHAQDNSMTVLGIYPVGGKYDDGNGGVVSGSSASGAAPYRFITYADRLFIEAELMKAGVITGDAKAKTRAAIEEAFNQVDYVITTYVKPANPVPKVATLAATTDYIDNVMTEYENNPGKQLEIIMTQKWLSSYGSHVDQYTDYRRTGYPILFDPNNAQHAPSHKFQPPINGDPVKPGAQDAVPVQLSRDYPLSLPWASDELNSNGKAPAQKSPSTYKVFWDK